MIIWNRERKTKAAAAVILLAAGMAAGNLAEAYEPAFPAENTVNEKPEAETQPAEKPEAAETASEVSTEEAPYEPAIDQLNLAYYYPEGADESDVMNSYAGMVYQELTVRDSDWLAGIYDLADVRPDAMAVRLGRPAASVYGKYNPNDSAHDPDQPDSWAIHSWKRVNVSFYNGSGAPINGYSNVKEILAMASVYTYQTDMMDAELFAEYARQLWDASHSYSVSMSDVYYCDGCLDKSEEELLAEAEAEELAAEFAASGDASAGAEETAKKAAEEARSAVDGQAERRDADGSGAGQAGAEPAAVLSDQIAETAAEPDDLIEETVPETDAEGNIKGTTIYKSTVDPTQWDHVGPGESQAPAATPSDALILQETEADPVASLGEAAAAGTEAVSSTGSAAETETPQTEQVSQAPSSSERGYHCPGHVDLNISVRILGLDDSGGLIAEDAIGNASQSQGSGSWDGWDDYAVNMVRAMLAQDWYQVYGLSISTINMRNPLSSSEIAAYMDSLPADLSSERREIIRFALSSVGKVPYYWGGKASRAGYEGNFFGTLVEADTKGRILKGLDCSGWINWVYWSVTGERLAGESTSSLAMCGRAIQRSELQPGDIIIKTGTGAHVVMFLGWADNGQMTVIHESSASVNNVTVKTMEADWPYYRNLID